MKLDEFYRKKPFEAKVIQTSRITPESTDEVRDIVFEVATDEFIFEPGQSIGLTLPGDPAFGEHEHFRLYTIANIIPSNDEKTRFSICVKRCFYVDEYSGERYPGLASNYLCGLRRHDIVSLTGPYGHPFEIPDDPKSDILMIGMGTGIAPFRAFVKKIYQQKGGWKGKVRLFHGARSGLELLYMNEKYDDFANYYDQETFKAFEALSPRPHMDDPIAMADVLKSREKEIWGMLMKPKTHVYIAGREEIRGMLDKAFSAMAGSEDKWQRRKAEMVAGRRWVEIIY